MRSKTKRIIAMIVAVVMVVLLVPVTSDSAKIYADTPTLESVLAAIGELSNDPRDFTAADADRVEAIQADYESLSAEDQATVDATFDHPSGDGQSYGRILEAALWAVRSFGTDTSTALADGTYTTTTEPAVSSESSKGKSDSTRTRNWWVESVDVVNGQATAYIYVTSGAATASKLTSYPSVWTGGQTINRDSNNNYAIPVDLNGTTYFGGISSSMPRPIMYSLSTTIEEPAVPVELAITNETGMFKAVTASYVLDSAGNATLTMALSGTGYHYLYKGTYEQAVANGTATENWIAGYQNAAGKWEFQIPIAADEIGTVVPVVAVSQSYYEKYLNGQNAIDRAFYPRQLTLDTTANTLITGDYESTKTIAVTNNVSMFKPGPQATLHTVGGPNSNNYAADLILPMLSSSYSNVFVGTPSEAAAAETTIAFDTDAMTFTIPVKWVATFGQPETLVSVCDGEPFVMSFQSASNGKWYGRQATLDEEAGTLVFDPWVDPAPAQTVDELIAKIQVQYFTDTTWADCEAAKAAWDALSDAEKALVEEYDYFGRDTGDASLDDPRNQDGIGEKEILVVSFGTSFNDSRVATIKAVEDAIEAEFGDEYSVRRAFTAQIIINHIYARDLEKLDNMQQALDRAVANGVKELVIQPTHLMHGAEYDELVEALAEYADAFDSIIISEPLLGEVGADATVINEDKIAVAQAVVAAACADAGYADAAAAAADGAAIVLMGHGTAHVASITYEQMQTAMGQLGYTNVFIGTVEGEPESTECSNVIAAVKAAGYTKVYLRPLMVVAGDHANNDMADPEDEESWFSQFTAEGNFPEENVFCQIKGLGEIPAVQQIYIQHIHDALESAAPVELAITNNTGMFKAVTASYVLDSAGNATLTMALSGTGYHYLYKGTYEQAVANGAATENWIAGYENAAGKWEFQIPIAADEIGTVVPVVAVSQSYYEKYLNGQNAIDRAFYPRQLTLDTTANTLVTADYESTKTITVTNNVGMFSPGTEATLHTVGGPNSNNYAADLILPMTSTSMTNVFVGTPAEAAAAETTIAFDTETNTFTIPVKWVETFGQPETLVSLCDGEPFVMSFKSKKNGTWYGRQATLDEEAGTLVFDPWTEPAVEVTLKAANLTLDGKISINFKLATESTGLVAKLYYEKVGFEQVAEVPLNSDNYVVDSNGNYYLVSYKEIPAKEMTQKLKIKVFDSTGTQVQMKISSGNIDEFEYSVATWCSKKISQNNNANDVMIAKALLNYGYYSQIALKYNDGLDGRPNNLPDHYEDEMNGFTGANDAYSSVTDGATALGAKAFALVLESDTAIKLKLRRAVDVLVDGTVTPELVQEVDGDGTDIWCVYLSGIPAKKLHERHSFKLTEGSNTVTLQYGALSWANKKLAGTNENDKNLATAMYLYNYAARKYFNYDAGGLQ